MIEVKNIQLLYDNKDNILTLKESCFLPPEFDEFCIVVGMFKFYALSLVTDITKHLGKACITKVCGIDVYEDKILRIEHHTRDCYTYALKEPNHE